MVSDVDLSPARISATYDVIRPYIRRTPVLEMGDGVVLKLELMQHAGSFKARGAFANLLTRSIPPVGVVASSGGNHGIAVAYAARTLGVPASIYVPVVSSPAKQARIRELGAELIVCETIAEAMRIAPIVASERGALYVHAFDQLETMLGQGTLGAEFDEQVPDLDTVIVPIGGGGLIAGIASWFNGRIRIVGVEPEDAPTMTRALEAGEPVDAATGSIANDSLAPARIGMLTFPVLRERLDRVLLVSDDAIRNAQEALWSSARVVAEPGGAAAYASLLSGAYVATPGERIGVIVSGGNSGAVAFAR